MQREITPPRTREELKALALFMRDDDGDQPWTPEQVAAARAWVAAQSEPQLLAAARFALDALTNLSTASFALGGDKAARVVLADAIESVERTQNL